MAETMKNTPDHPLGARQELEACTRCGGEQYMEYSAVTINTYPYKDDYETEHKWVTHSHDSPESCIRSMAIRIGFLKA